jgi:O-succinylbenzoic acid--CoA ligase
MPKHLVAIDLAAPAAAREVAAVWRSGDAVHVVDRAASGEVRAAALAAVRPTRLVDTSGVTDLDGDAPADEVCAVVLTSGTTVGRAVDLTERGVRHMAGAYTTALGLDAADGWLAVMPLSGVAGLAIVARGYVTETKVTVHDGFDVAAVAREAAGGSVTVVSLVPTMLHRLFEADVPLDRLGTLVVGGAPLSRTLHRAAAGAGARLVTSYGMTETWGGFALDGRPLDGAEVRIAGDGEVQVKGPMVMAGYRGDPAATASAFDGDWLRTRDSGTWDGTRLEITGRLDDVIISGGIKVSPSMVEDALVEHGLVADAAVIGEEDEEWGQRIVAEVVAADPQLLPTLQELRDHVGARLSMTAAPREVRFVEAIERNRGGKVVRRRP